MPGLQEAKRRLDYLKMTVAEQKVYDRYLYNKFYREDVLNTSRTKGIVEGYHEGKAEGLQEGLEKGRAEGEKAGLEKGIEQGRAEGRKEGRAEGREEGIREMIRKMQEEGYSPEEIDRITGA